MKPLLGGGLILRTLDRGYILVQMQHTHKRLIAYLGTMSAVVRIDITCGLDDSVSYRWKLDVHPNSKEVDRQQFRFV